MHTHTHMYTFLTINVNTLDGGGGANFGTITRTQKHPATRMRKQTPHTLRRAQLVCTYIQIYAFRNECVAHCVRTTPAQHSQRQRDRQLPNSSCTECYADAESDADDDGNENAHTAHTPSRIELSDNMSPHIHI